MLREGQAEQLAAAGLDYYNHNLDTAPEFLRRSDHHADYEDRLDTLGKGAPRRHARVAAAASSAWASRAASVPD